MMERDMEQAQTPHDSELCEIRTVLLAGLVSLSLFMGSQPREIKWPGF